MVAVRLRSGSVRDTTLARLSRAPKQASKPALSSNRGAPLTRAPASAQRAASAAMASGAHAGHAQGKENGGHKQQWAVYKQQARSRTKPPAAQPKRQDSRATASYTSVRAKQRQAAASASAAGGSEGADGGEDGEDLMARLRLQLDTNAALLNRDPNTAEAT